MIRILCLVVLMGTTIATSYVYKPGPRLVQDILIPKGTAGPPSSSPAPPPKFKAQNMLINRDGLSNGQANMYTNQSMAVAAGDLDG